MNYVIEHERFKCIQCSACAMVLPEYWEMNSKDCKADLKHSKQTREGVDFEERLVSEAQALENREAVRVCPVDCIKVKTLKGELLK